ncbi:MAG: CapA family protein [Clostridia bacterium]|nr:CapA family protein [Clostridia bacterium]
MSEQEQRGVSAGTILMLLLTVVVTVCCIIILPRLMGPVNIRMDDNAMLSSTNLNDSLPELAQNDIPLTFTTPEPEATSVPAATETPVPMITAAAEPTAVPVTASLSLTFGGSINVDDLIRKSGFYSDTDKYDFSENLSLISQELDSDYTLVTLECITDADGNVRQIPNGPPEVMGMLTSANVDMVALGYNRAFERGIEGVSATIREAEGSGMQTLGLYDSPEDAANMRIVDVNGVQIAYLHYATSITNTAKRKMNTDDASYAMPITNINSGGEQIAADIAGAREAGAHVVVVVINWSGTDSVNTTTTKMKNFMQTLADAGADVIIGTGTKTVKEVSWFVGKREDGSTHQTLCAWSLGSLLNGERNNGNVAGMLLHVQLNVGPGGVNFERVSYTPTYIWRFKQDDYYRYRVVASDQPAPAGMDDSQASNAARALETLRKALGNSPITMRIK